MTLRIASAQFPVCIDLEANTRAICAQIEEAAAQGARIIAFPETALCGYTPWERPDLSGFDWDALERATERVCAVARQQGIWVLLGSLTPTSDPQRPLNSVRLLGPDGQAHGRYDKRLLTRSEGAHFTPGVAPFVFAIDGTSCGVAICHEWRYPEVYREYASLGVEVVFHCWYDGGYDAEAWAREGRDLAEVIPMTARAHAVCNHMWVVGSNTSRARSSFAAFVARPDGGLHAVATSEQTEVLVADLTPREQVPDPSGHHRPRLVAGARVT